MDDHSSLTPVTGAILAGGRSRRMGRDKASIELGGRSLIARAIDAVSQVAEDVLICGGNGLTEAPSCTRIIKDTEDGIGPIGGIVAALRASAFQHCLVVACDMPFLNTALLRYLIELAPNADAVVPEIDGRTHQTHAVYSKVCLPYLEAQIATGNYRVQDLFPRVTTRYVMRDEVQRFDPLRRSLMNLNTPEELAEAERILAELEP